VQGRYFFVPALLIFVAFTRPFVRLLTHSTAEQSSLQKMSQTTLVQSWTQKMSLAVLILLSGTALYCTSHLLLGRYYLMPEQADVSQWRPVWISASSQDDKSSYLPVVFSTYQMQQPARLQSISLFLDLAPTHGNQTQTSQPITLQLWNAQGLERQIAASTSATAASGYLTINVPQDAYTKGKIIASKEFALRMKGVQQNNGEQRACIIYELSDGSRRYTPGCP
jgi:hypothetical protein